MVRRCKIQYKILLDHRLRPVVNLLHQVLNLLREVNPLPVLHHHPVQHKLLLVILQDPLLQISLPHKEVALNNQKQGK
jgi:hypothetical protein